MKRNTFRVGGRDVSVALGSITLIGWDIPNSAYINLNWSDAKKREKIQSLFNSFDSINADIKMLSIHTQGATSRRAFGSDYTLLRQISEEFIKNHDGKVVFGHGPHTHAGVKVINGSKGKGVVFSSLGNFIHQQLSNHSDNYVGRVLLNKRTLDVEQVQVSPFGNSRTSLSLRTTSNIKANFQWQRQTRNVAGKDVGVYYANFQPPVEVCSARNNSQNITYSIDSSNKITITRNGAKSSKTMQVKNNARAELGGVAVDLIYDVTMDNGERVFVYKVVATQQLLLNHSGITEQVTVTCN